MTINKILASKSVAEEKYQVADSIDYQHQVIGLKNIVNSTQNITLIGIVGNYGIGKSVMLNSYKEQNVSNEGAVWIHFDAWKYPNRDNLWEGFVLDFVRQFAPAEFKKVQAKIDGTKNKSLTTLIKNAPSVGTIAITGNIALAPLGDKLGNLLASFTASSPAKRVFEIQEIIATLIISDKEKRRIYIEVEDADRADQAGIYFIETLSHFMRTLHDYKGFSKGTEIKIFVPIARTSFFGDEGRQQAYVKALDVVEFFEPKVLSLSNFLRNLLDDDLLNTPRYLEYFEQWCMELVYHRSKTIRDLKFILRNADIRFSHLIANGARPDPAIVFMLESQKYMFKDDVNNFKAIKAALNTAREVEMDKLLKAIANKRSYSEWKQVQESSLINTRENANSKVHFYDPMRDIHNMNLIFAPDAETDTIIPTYQYSKYYLPLFYIEG